MKRCIWLIVLVFLSCYRNVINNDELTTNSDVSIICVYRFRPGEVILGGTSRGKLAGIDSLSVAIKDSVSFIKFVEKVYKVDDNFHINSCLDGYGNIDSYIELKNNSKIQFSCEDYTNGLWIKNDKKYHVTLSKSGAVKIAEIIRAQRELVSDNRKIIE